MCSEFINAVQIFLQTVERKEGDYSALRSLALVPLNLLGLLGSSSDVILPPSSYHSIIKYIQKVQHVILTDIAPNWEVNFKESGDIKILRAYFYPISILQPNTILNGHGLILLHAYTSLAAVPFSSFSLETLALLTRNANLDICFKALSESKGLTTQKKTSIWEDCTRAVMNIPTKIANQGLSNTLDGCLSHEKYFKRVCKATHNVLNEPSTTEGELQWIQFLLEKLILNGLFPSARSSFATVSFFGTNKPPNHSQNISKRWSEVFQRLTWSNRHSVICSLFATIRIPDDAYDIAECTLALVTDGIRHLEVVLGEFAPEAEIVSQLSQGLAKFSWNFFLGRVIIHWLMLNCHNTSRIWIALFDDLLITWTTKEFIDRSLLSQHQGLSAIILFLLSKSEDDVRVVIARKTSSSPMFISSIGRYISHQDKSVRRCGLLVAETVAAFSGKQLSFGGWGEGGTGQQWANSIACLMGTSFRPTSTLAADSSAPAQDAIQSDGDSDDSITGYAPQCDSSDSSPSQENLSALINDSSLRNGPKKKIAKPVYITQLLNYLRPSAKVNKEQDSERLIVALNCCEELIRRKKSYGTELVESAAELARALIQVQNEYEVERFDELRQVALSSLVSSVPRIVAPAIIEEYFLQMYSTDQRILILNSLARGAGDLSTGQAQSLFPSRILEGSRHALHESNTPARIQIGLVPANSAQSQAGERPSVAGLVSRRKQLRVGVPSQVHEGGDELYFHQIAAEYFICPLVNLFWSYLRDNYSREVRTRFAARSYKGSGTGMVMHSLILGHYLRTLTFLMHAGQNSPAYLAVLAPEVLQLSLMLGAKCISDADRTEEDNNAAGVLSAALELALVVVVGCKELDGGKSICLENASLMLGLGEWAEQTVSLLDTGIRFAGGGGELESSLLNNALGLCKQLSDISSSWRNSMVDVF